MIRQNILFNVLLLTSILIFASSTKLNGQSAPWQNTIQQVPGRIEFEFYDEGGERVAYHDSDSTNNGSGKLNPANGTYLNEFRMKEGWIFLWGKFSSLTEDDILFLKQLLL